MNIRELSPTVDRGPVGVDIGLVAFDQALVHSGLDIDLPTYEQVLVQDGLDRGHHFRITQMHLHTSVFAASQTVELVVIFLLEIPSESRQLHTCKGIG